MTKNVGGPHLTPDRELLRALAVIPAPSGDERRRSAFCLKWLQAHGVTDAYMDEAGNVRIPFGDQSGALDVFAAHSDVVFPDTEELPYREDASFIHCPGIGDNTAHVTALMQYASEIARSGARVKDGGLLFVINVGEEGLGNLKGSKALVRELGCRIRSFVTFDSVTAEVVTRAVGSVRWRVTVRTPGGHSFRDFGTPNAIGCLAELIGRLSEALSETAARIRAGVSAQEEAGNGVTSPTTPQMTWNVGTIEGGTSVNTIAQEASMLFECRADSQEALTSLRETFDETCASFRTASGGDVSLSTEIIGERPSASGADPDAVEAMAQRAESVIRAYYQEEPFRTSGSTDANSALARGIPSICFGLCRGEGAHTREEKLRIDSLAPGLRAGWAFISDLLER